MDFPQRKSTTLRLSTRVVMTVDDGGLHMDLTVDGPEVDWALELALRGATTMEGATRLPSGSWHLDAAREKPRAVCATDAHGVSVEVLRATGPDGGVLAPAIGEPAYEPGEEYRYLGGSDAVTALGAPDAVLYVTGRSPSRVHLQLGIW